MPWAEAFVNALPGIGLAISLGLMCLGVSF